MITKPNEEPYVDSSNKDKYPLCNKVLRKLLGYCVIDPDSDDLGKALLEAYNVASGCVNMDVWVHGEISQAVIHKLSHVYEALYPRHEVIIQPSYEGESAVVVLDGDKVIYKEWYKSWQFGVEPGSTLATLEEFFESLTVHRG